MTAAARNTNPTPAVQAALTALFTPGETFEIRVPAPATGWPVFGYFNDPAAAVQAAAAWSGKAEAVYVTLNPVNPALLARANNRIKQASKKTSATSDADIVVRHWLPVDIDPVRPAGISSSDEEHAAALEKGRAIKAWLDTQGWPTPLMADSGNGAHLLYRVDLPNDDESKGVIEGCLKALAARFDDHAGNGVKCPVKVDTGVFNAARIWKLYGTLAAKGDATADRPHRMARMIDVPESAGVVSRKSLQALADSAQKPPQPARVDRPAPSQAMDSRSGGDFFTTVNERALANLSAWVPTLFPSATEHHQGYRITSRDLGRDLEEDLSIQPNGIKDFGVHDMGDATSGGRTAIDLVIEHGRESDAKAAALWLCGQLGIEPESIGWKRRAERPQSTPVMDMPVDDAGYLEALGSAEPPKAEGQGIQPPKWKPLDLDAMRDARLHPRCIVEYQLYADLAVVNAEGGTGKTTLLLYEAVHIALGRDLWGCRVLNPGRTLFITAEDGEEILQARLLKIMDALNMTDYERRKVADSIMFWDLSGTMARLAELDARGNLVLTELADRIVDTYCDAGLAQVIFDPVVSFSPGERIVNDGEQAIVTACRRITRGLDCCVRLIHHSGQANARNGAIDQYAGRGGTALPDGCRMVTILANATRVLLPKPDGFDLQPGETGFLMARAKLSYAPPQPNIWIRRRGWTFEYFIETPRNAEAVRDHDADKVAKFLTEELHHGRRYTARSLEDSGRLKLPRARLRAALATLETAGRLDERELPTDQRRGRKKHYLHCAKASGAIAAEMDTQQPTATPIAPDISIAPPYRDRNGAIAAVPSPASSIAPAKRRNSGAMAQ
ncbi:MAG: AAA family ATPase [Candidatus Competibacteraceae bacterium]|nr:AAA family ATPase [Candidatus Competibacteraceae bacterium]